MQFADVSRADAPLHGAVVAREGVSERLYLPMSDSFVVDGTERAQVARRGVGAHALLPQPPLVAGHKAAVDARQRHVLPAAVETDERPHGGVVVLHRGGTHAPRGGGEEGGEGRLSLPVLSFPFLFSLLNSVCVQNALPCFSKK